MLIHEGFTYIFERNGQDSKRIWRCSDYTRTKCKGRCHTRKNNTVSFVSEHNHALSHAKVGAKLLKAEIKKAAISETSSPTSVILANSVKNVSVDVAAALPNIRSLKRTIQMARSIALEMPQSPSTLEELEIPEEYMRVCYVFSLLCNVRYVFSQLCIVRYVPS